MYFAGNVDSRKYASARTGNRDLAHRKSAFVLIILISLLLLNISCGVNKKSPNKLTVAASIFPLADFCKQIGRDKIEVRALVPAGANPHTFELSSSQVRFLSRAKIFVYNGLGLETWAEELAKKIGGNHIVLLPCAETIPQEKLIRSVSGESASREDHVTNENLGESTEEEGEHGHGAFDPHVWLNPKLAIYQVKAIASAFSKADPENKPYYQRNANSYVRNLKRIDEWIARKVSAFRKIFFVATHPSLTYFAKRYGLIQVASIEELPGKEPSVQHVREIIEKMKKLKVKVVLAERQINPKAAEIIARESGEDVKVIKFDPIGDPDDKHLNSYEKIMRLLVENLERGMG